MPLACFSLLWSLSAVRLIALIFSVPKALYIWQWPQIWPVSWADPFILNFVFLWCTYLFGTHVTLFCVSAVIVLLQTVSWVVVCCNSAKCNRAWSNFASPCTVLECICRHDSFQESRWSSERFVNNGQFRIGICPPWLNHKWTAEGCWDDTWSSCLHICLHDARNAWQPGGDFWTKDIITTHS